ncbi:uncharacterized protein BXZ73DRAFT_46228 [Epithele typhae]|uniref:uncharacterized protein n=1 Tax=Epithele typhae TaxID=378194 RepID=UPI0020086571|nr:uncharacterized protein BXZ73DRAFT_46228 [Epithele typhae]KAH9933630.1 hypothetical protein BXZ73DRAFT_46228 [Epithele typhae]
MTAPTQVLPPWLTLSSTVITMPDGRLTTAATTIQLPLTYYGPSIPLGTDGVWVYGGLTSPPPSSATPTSTSVSAITSSSATLPTTSTSIISSSAATSTTTPPSTTASSSSTSTVPTAVAGSSRISPTILGAILGSVLGTLLLLVLLVIIYLLCRTRRREPSSTQQSSSFWNRSTTLMSLRRRKSSATLPIWTGWEIVRPGDRPVGGGSEPGTPGEGSPRGSGDEVDPFLTRRSIHSGTEEMGQTRTDTDTLVSLPAIARAGSMSGHHSTTKAGNYIIPRDVQMRIADEEAGEFPSYASVRMVERRAPHDYQLPLLPPPPRESGRPSSHPSYTSEKSKAARSVISERSGVSNVTDGQEPEAEVLTACRVHVGQVQPFAIPGPSSSSTGGVLGLNRIGSITRTAWFRRMPFLGPHDGAQPVPTSEEAADGYTRTPPRHSRAHSRSQPGSPSRPSSYAAVRMSGYESGPDSFGRRVRGESGLGFALVGERPISSVSAQSAASGGTLFYDASSRPGSSMGTRSTQGGPSSAAVPPVPALSPAHLPHPSPLSQEIPRPLTSPEHLYSESTPDAPPTYDAATSHVDFLDMPVPRPASPFRSVSGPRMSPPGLPDPTVWRNSHASSSTRTPNTDNTSSVHIDVLEDAPPVADGGWMMMSGGGRADGRRLTFGVPMVVQPRDAIRSEQGSLHSMRSHLSPVSSRSPSGSAGASLRSGGSHSRGHTGSSGASLVHSNSIGHSDHRPGRLRADPGEVPSPPLSAVFPGNGYPSSSSPPMHGADVLAPVASARLVVPTSAPMPDDMPARPQPATISGTMTSRATAEESLTDLSVTTSQTDPITGATVHIPRVPLRNGTERAWGEGPLREDTIW